jgi:hypothetical protein
MNLEIKDREGQKVYRKIVELNGKLYTVFAHSRIDHDFSKTRVYVNAPSLGWHGASSLFCQG